MESSSGNHSGESMRGIIVGGSLNGNNLSGYLNEDHKGVSLLGRSLIEFVSIGVGGGSLMAGIMERGSWSGGSSVR